MAGELNGVRVAFLVANEGVEQVELIEPLRAVKAAGGVAEIVAPRPGETQAMNHLDKGDRFPVDRTTAEVTADDFDALVLPGGVANPDQLRQDGPAIEFIQDMFDAGKPASGDLPRSLEPGRGRPRERPDPYFVAQLAYRHRKRRGRLGRRGGPGLHERTERPSYESAAR